MVGVLPNVINYVDFGDSRLKVGDQFLHFPMGKSCRQYNCASSTYSAPCNMEDDEK